MRQLRDFVNKARPNSLKRRTAWALVGIVAVFVLLQGGLAYLSLSEQEDDLADALVQAEAKRLESVLARDEVSGIRSIALVNLSPNFSGWLIEPGGVTLPGPLPAHLEDIPHGLQQFSLEGAEYHVYSTPTRDGQLLVQYDASQSEEKVHHFGFYLLCLGVLCIVTTYLLAGYVAAVVAAPIERITRLLSSWAPNPAAMEAKASLPLDEEGRLLDAFSQVQARFEHSVANEREFMSNARHEIMTPMSAVRTDLEMLALEIPPQYHARLQRALDGLDTIAGSVGLIQTLASRQPAITEQVHLRLCVEDAWRSLQGSAFDSNLVFVNKVAESAEVVADRHALLTILRNLFRNAAEHAAPRTCTVSWSTRGIEVADDGIGIAAADLPFVFDRYYRGGRIDSPESSKNDGRERGLGLAIAYQVATLNGWRLRVESLPERGACFILDLAESAA